jgi:rhamnosyltransferase
MISYGADDCLPFDNTVLSDFNLTKNDYYLVVARLVPENNIEEIIKSFLHYIGEKKLIIVGFLENTTYVRHLKKISNFKVKFTGAIYEKKIIDSLRQGCFIYIHGHSVGGTNPALLEAMAAGCACICHENIFNREVTGGSQIYFHSSSELAILMNLLEHKKMDLEIVKQKAIERVRAEYSWNIICNSYIELFKSLHSPDLNKTSFE